MNLIVKNLAQQDEATAAAATPQAQPANKNVVSFGQAPAVSCRIKFY